MERLGFALGRVVRRWPALTWIGWGLALGAVFGLFFGGIGIAARGGAVGVSGWLVFAVIGGAIAFAAYRRKAKRAARVVR